MFVGSRGWFGGDHYFCRQSRPSDDIPSKVLLNLSVFLSAQSDTESTLSQSRYKHVMSLTIVMSHTAADRTPPSCRVLRFLKAREPSRRPPPLRTTTSSGLGVERLLLTVSASLSRSPLILMATAGSPGSSSSLTRPSLKVL